MKNVKILLFALLFAIAGATVTACAATFSSFWYQDAAGAWHIKDAAGNMVKDAWLCDDAVSENGQNVWYLIDGNGNMISAGLVQDGTGNYYSIETNHDGYYGMLRYESKTYNADGTAIALSLESAHGGSFAAIKNADGLSALREKYGVTKVNIDNSNIVYTSRFGTPASAASAGALTASDFTASGNSVPQADLAGYLSSRYGNDAAVYFYYDSSQDPSREGVVKTNRGITLASTRQDVISAYGQGTEVSLSAPQSVKAIQIAYGFDPAGVTNYAKSCLKYQTADGKYALYFCFKDNGQISYIFYYLV